MQNVEELIFYDDQAKKLLPECRDYFNQWAFAKQFSGFRQLARRTLSDFLDSLGGEQLAILGKYLGDEVTIDKLDYRTIRNESYSIEEVELRLGDMDGFQIVPYRDKDQVYITFWR